MFSLIPTIQCALRLSFAILLGHTVALEIFTSDPTLTGAFAVRLPEFGTSIICVVLASISIWLILGIGTRTVALAGAAIYLAHEALVPGFNLFDLQAAQSCLLVASLALPLVIFGGGRFSVIAVQTPEPV